MPVPIIEELLYKTTGSSWFLSVEFKKCYRQIELASEDKEKTAFSFDDEFWQFKVLPFGLCSAPATFYRAMSMILQNLIGKICVVYLGDILIFGTLFEEHLWN